MTTANEFKIKVRDFSHAVSSYTQAIELDPSQTVFFLNRAQAYLKLALWPEAESDASQALRTATEPSEKAKAFFRRGIARRRSGRSSLAFDDFTHALDYGAGEDARKELASLKPENGRSQQKTQVPQQSEMPRETPGKSWSDLKSKRTEKAAFPKQPTRPDEKSTKSEELNDSSSNAKVTYSPSPSDAKSTNTPPPPSPAKIPTADYTAEKVFQNPVKNSFDFESRWFHATPEAQTLLLQNLGSDLASFFKTGLSFELFSSIADVLAKQDEDESWKVRLIEQMPKIPRWDLSSAFLLDSEKEGIRSLFRRLDIPQRLYADWRL